MTNSNFYTEIYKQANLHSVETDKKRDQLLAFYAVVTGVFLGSYNTLIDPIRDLITIALVIFTLVLVFVFISYRKWHSIYVNTAIVVQHLASRKKGFNKKEISAAWDHFFGKTDYRTADQKPIRKLLSSTILSVEFMIFNSFLVISSPALYLMFENVFLVNDRSWLNGWQLSDKYFLSLAIYLLVINLLSSFIIGRELARKESVSWLLRT